MAKCPNCQQVKVEHQKPGDLSQTVGIPTFKWEEVNMDFIIDLPHTRRQYDSIWDIIDRLKNLFTLFPSRFPIRWMNMPSVA